MFAFFSELQDSFTTIEVYLYGFLQRIVEVYGSGAVDDDVNIIDN